MLKASFIIFIVMSLCISCNSEYVPDAERQKLSAKIDSMNAALAKSRNRIYLELQSENEKLALTGSHADSNIINRRIKQLNDSVYECRKAAEDIEVYWINNK